MNTTRSLSTENKHVSTENSIVQLLIITKRKCRDKNRQNTNCTLDYNLTRQRFLGYSSSVRSPKVNILKVFFYRPDPLFVTETKPQSIAVVSNTRKLKINRIKQSKLLRRSAKDTTRYTTKHIEYSLSYIPNKFESPDHMNNKHNLTNYGSMD